jgi:hypothetical protein
MKIRSNHQVFPPREAYLLLLEWHSSPNSSHTSRPSPIGPSQDYELSTPFAKLQMRTKLIRSLLPLAHDPNQVNHPKNPDDYPLVLNWNNGPESDAGVGWGVKFLVNENGIMADQARIKQMREELENIFSQINKFMPTALKEQWQKFDLSFCEIFFGHMCLKLPLAVTIGKLINSSACGMETG